MTGLDVALATSALGLTVAGAALGLRGCAGRGARAWVVHLVTTAAMLAMLVPAELAAAAQRLGGPGPAEWPLVMLVALAWTAADGVRSRVAALRRVAAVDPRALALAARGHAREAVDLAATTLLLLAMGAGALPSATSGPVLAGPSGGHPHAQPGGTPDAAPVLVLAGWAAALLVLALGRRGHDHWGLAGSGGMLAAMALMAAGHATG